MPNTYQVHCDCGAVEIVMSGTPNAQAFCHCRSCRELLQVPFHSVTAWNSSDVSITKGEADTTTFQHPTRKMKRVFCSSCGDTLYNTNAMDWKLVSQSLIRKCYDDQLPAELSSKAHFFWSDRLHEMQDDLPKKD